MKKEEDFLKRFESNIRREKLLRHRDHILVGFSGGPDSTALLTAFYHLRSKYRLNLLAAHINYNLRGEDNAREEKFVKEFCFSHNISLLIKQYDAGSDRINENNLRDFRRNWFNSLVKLYKIDNIALGHNRSDQAETILYRLLRGSLLTGLAGIRPRSGKTIHPLLPFSRTEITEFLESEKVVWCEDSSNKANYFTRNKLRNTAFPWIEANINPRAIDKISDTAPFLLQADEILKGSALARMRHVLEENNEEEYSLKIPDLLKIRPLLRFYIYRHLYSRITGSEQDFYQSNFEIIEQSLSRTGNRQIQLPHQVCFKKEYEYLKLMKNGSQKEKEFEQPREIPSLRNRITYDGWRITMKKLKIMPRHRDVFVDRNIAYLDFDKIQLPLVVRHRQSGDRFIPYGMTQSKKLKDFFIDLKLPVQERSETLIFTDQEKILWVGEQRIDQRVAINEETSNILMLRIEKIRYGKSRPAERMKRR